MRYTVDYANGAAADTDVTWARACALARHHAGSSHPVIYGPHGLLVRRGDPAPDLGDGRRCLVWRSEAESRDDAGRRAIASIEASL